LTVGLKERNLTPLAREGALDADQYRLCLDRVERDASLLVLRDLTLDLCRSPVLPVALTPRSLDPAHFGTALWFHDAEPIDRFVTTDTSQEQAAREVGLPV